jgi:hypothetical protein
MKILFSGILFLTLLGLVRFHGESVTAVAPGTYVEIFWKNDNNYNLDVDLTVTHAPDSAIILFWAHQFSFVNGSGGYIGLQIVGSSRKAIFSIWDAVRGEPGVRFTHEGEGWSIIIDHDWKIGERYRLRIWVLGREANGDEWWLGTVYEYSSGRETVIGKILVPELWGWLGSWSVTWIEYAGYQTCDVPFTRAEFSNLYARNAAGDGPPDKLKASYGTSPCTNSDIDYYGETHYALKAGQGITRDTNEGWLTTVEEYDIPEFPGLTAMVLITVALSLFALQEMRGERTRSLGQRHLC